MYIPRVEKQPDSGTPVVKRDSATPQDAALTSKNDADVPVALPFDYDACMHGEARADCDERWCSIPAGCFVMESPENEFARARVAEVRNIVTLSHSFQMQRYEVTRGLWKILELPDPSTKRDDGTGD